jgi:Spy/CpxP family protein refolding chaperone
MKKGLLLIFFALLTAFTVDSYAQRPAKGHHGQRDGKRPEITEMVSNLTDAQKGKLETITKESRQKVDRLRNQQKVVRDSIGKYMDREGDQSKKLYPLFDREAQLQVQISREMYSTKVRIDKVLTKEQRKEFQQASKRDKRHGKKH